MRKLLILLVVIGLTSVVSAGMILDIEVDGVDYDGETLALTGSAGVFLVSFVGTEGTATDTTGTSYYTGPGNFSGDQSTWFQEKGGWDWLLNGGAYFSGGLFNVNKSSAVGGATPGTPGLGTTMHSEANITTGFGVYNQNVQMYTATAEFTFTATETGDVAFDLGNWNGVTVSGSELIIVPEPMTIALLGLGSLVLLRRKK